MSKQFFKYNQPFKLESGEELPCLEIAYHTYGELNKKKNNIDIQNKQILERARESFRNENFENVRDGIVFLKDIQFFGDDYLSTIAS